MAPRPRGQHYEAVLSEIMGLLEAARGATVRAVNCIMTATYWEIGRRISETEQKGEDRAGYGEKLIRRLSADLTKRFGRGFSKRNLEQMRLFYRVFQIAQTLSAQSVPSAPVLRDAEIAQTASAQFDLASIAARFPLPWSHYVKLLTVRDPEARAFYEEEALLGGWSVRQLDRQISSQFYERTLLSKNKAAMLRRGSKPRAEDAVTVEEQIKDPYVLEFLDLKDDYSESDLEEALIRTLESFLLELGNDFAFIGRQRRLRIGDEWYRIDLLLFHRRLRCLVVVDLKLGRFTHSEAGQMNLYLNYAREHWTHEDENPPVGIILCTQRNSAVAHYALEGLSNKVLAAEYRMVLPDEGELVEELKRTRRLLEAGQVREPRSGKGP